MGIGLENIASPKKPLLGKFSKRKLQHSCRYFSLHLQGKKLKIVLVGVPDGNRLVLSSAGKTYIKRKLDENHLFIKGEDSEFIIEVLKSSFL